MADQEHCNERGMKKYEVEGDKYCHESKKLIA
jgi:hypothetical protein